MVGTYITNCYTFDGLMIKTVERQEHLPEKNRKKKGNTDLLENVVPEKSGVRRIGIY